MLHYQIEYLGIAYNPINSVMSSISYCSFWIYRPSVREHTAETIVVV